MYLLTNTTEQKKMIIESKTGTVYNISSDTSRLTITVTKAGSTSTYIAPAQAKTIGGVLLVTRENGARVEMPIRGMGIENEINELIAEAK